MGIGKSGNQERTKFKRIILTFCMVVLIQSAFSQDYLGYSKDKIIKYYRTIVNRGYTVSFYDTITKEDTLDHLLVDINGKSKIRCDYFFAKEGYCDSIILGYQCNECAESGVKQVLGVKHLKWKALDGGFYISRFIFDKVKKDEETYIRSPLLQIIKTPIEKVCTIIYISVTPLMPKDKWRAITHK